MSMANATNAIHTDQVDAAVNAADPNRGIDDTLDDFERSVVQLFDEAGEYHGEGDVTGDEPVGGEVDEDGAEEGGAEVDPPTPGSAQGGTDPSGQPNPDDPTDRGTEGQPQPDPTTQATDAPDVYLGRPRADVEAALQTYDWARALPPEAIRGIEGYLSGAYVLVPAGSAPDAPPSQTSQNSQATNDLDALDPDDPVVQRMRAIESELNDLRSSAQQTVQSEQQRREQQFLQAIDEQTDIFAKTHELTDAEKEKVVATAARLSTVQTGLAAYPSDYGKAVAHALDLAYFSEPEFRDREVNRRLQQELQSSQTLAERKRKAGAVTASSGSVRKPTPTPPEKMTAEERDRAITEEIAAAINNR